MTKGPSPSAQLLAALVDAGLRPLEVEYKFHPDRRWRFDFAWPKQRLAVEVEGGIFVRGRHVSPSGFVKDSEKYNEAAVSGWSVLRIPVAGKTWIEDAVDLVGRWFHERA
jgi:very-short-patch-repair endonuclease